MAENQGHVSQVLGAVVDVSFLPGQLPDIFEAVRVPREGQDDLILEVQTLLGGGGEPSTCYRPVHYNSTLTHFSTRSNKNCYCRQAEG